MNFNFNETYFLEKLATRPRSRPKIAQIEVFDHFLDFASLVFFGGPVNVFLSYGNRLKGVLPELRFI